MKFTPRKSIVEEELQVPSFDKDRTYDADSIIDLIMNSFVLEDENIPALLQVGKNMNIEYDNNDPELVLDDICNKIFRPTYGMHDEMDAEELEDKLLKFAKVMQFNQAQLNELIADIMHTKNPKADRVSEFTDDIESDIRSIQNLLSDGIITFPAQVRLNKLIEELKKLEYSGAANETWTYNTYDKDKKYYKLIGDIEED